MLLPRYHAHGCDRVHVVRGRTDACSYRPRTCGYRLYAWLQVGRAAAGGRLAAGDAAARGDGLPRPHAGIVSVVMIDRFPGPTQA